jgi:hypothetical protein
MFKVGDQVNIIVTDGWLEILSIQPRPEHGFVKQIAAFETVTPYLIDVGPRSWWFAAQDLELVEEKKATLGHIEGHDPLDNPNAGVTRTFDSGATRDTDQGKLDYVKALSPIVLRRYVQYLDKHRKQSDGSYRDFDNWKQGIPQEAYISGGGRHFLDTWLLTEGYATEDNHGPVEIEDAICAQLFNLMGRLHEMLDAQRCNGGGSDESK